MSYEKLIARHVHASSVGWTLIDNGKLTNHIARLEATVVKSWLGAFWAAAGDE